MRFVFIFLGILILASVAVIFVRQCDDAWCMRIKNDQPIIRFDKEQLKFEPQPKLPKQATVPRRSREPNESERVVKVYFYNPAKDTDKNGILLCSKQGMEAVERIIPLSESPIQDTLKLLFEGALTEEEREAGLATEFPLPGVIFKAFVLTDGQAIVVVTDEEHKTSGGTCRVGILRAQIEETIRQFVDVSEVNYRPLDAFQP